MAIGVLRWHFGAGERPTKARHSATRWSLKMLNVLLSLIEHGIIRSSRVRWGLGDGVQWPRILMGRR